MNTQRLLQLSRIAAGFFNRVIMQNRLLLLIAVLVFMGCAKDRSRDWVYGNGRIEGDEVRVAAKISGRILHLKVEEGDRVEQGQLLVELSSEEFEAQHQQATATVKAAQAALARAEAQLATLRHHEETARTDYERMKSLYESGAAPAQKLDQAENALEEVRGRVKDASAHVSQLQAQIQAAKATEAATRTTHEDTRIHAPLEGVVLLRLAEEGEVILPGTPILVLVDPNDLFLKVYIPEKEIGKIRVGNPSTVKVDAFPDRTFEGRVSEVAQQAEFTPKDIHMPDERTQLVYAVKIRLDNPEGYLKPGMVADAEIRWKTLGTNKEP